MSLSYHPLILVDVSVHAVAVHRGHALSVQPISLRHGSELVRRPVAIEPVTGLLILNQPIAPPPLMGLLLGQIDLVYMCWLHLLLQHLHAKKNYICISM
jgi:hypothetical protein